MSNSLFKKHFLFFGGKGGVGKTTMAATAAIHAADLGISTLLVSTDPAHSVSDSLDQQIGGEDYVQVKDVENLCAIELNTDQAMRTYSDMLSQQDPTGAFSELFGDEDPNSLSPPGADETVAFIQLLEFIQNPEFDMIYCSNRSHFEITTIARVNSELVISSGEDEKTYRRIDVRI
ncbi:MAG: ArsA-related P-loop ATPase [Promethearchaeota archaeon]|jgi:arsenite-transporting ATPase